MLSHFLLRAKMPTRIAPTITAIIAVYKYVFETLLVAKVEFPLSVVEVGGFELEGEVCGAVAPEFWVGVGVFTPGGGVLELIVATVTVPFVHVQLISLFSSIELLGMSLISAGAPIVIGELPAASTRKVMVARTPLPLTVVSSANAQFISGISPSLKARVELEVHRKKVESLLFRNGPS